MLARRRESDPGLTDGDITVRALKHLVHAVGAEGGVQDSGDGFSSHDVSFLCVVAANSCLGLLIRMMMKGRPYSSKASTMADISRGTLNQSEYGERNQNTKFRQEQ